MKNYINYILKYIILKLFRNLLLKDYWIVVWFVKWLVVKFSLIGYLVKELLKFVKKY